VKRMVSIKPTKTTDRVALRNSHCGFILVNLPVAIIWIGLGAVTVVRDSSNAFQAGDYVFRGVDDLQWYRGNRQLNSWGQSWTICADNQQNLWAGFVQDGKVVLRRFSAPTRFQDYPSAASFAGGTIAKVIFAGDQLYVLVTVPHGGRQRERLIKLVPFSISNGSFGAEVVLKDYNGQPELLLLPPLPPADRLPKPRKELLTHGIWDALLFGKNQLWISTQDQIVCYSVGVIPPIADHAKIANAGGTGVRKKVVHRRDMDVGNPRGIAPYSETQIVLVDCSGGGRLILLNVLGPVVSFVLMPEIDSGVTFTWGWHGVLVSNNDFFVSNLHPNAGRVACIDRTTWQVKDNLVSGFPVSEIVEIR
jgi:hypothetical protein